MFEDLFQEPNHISRHREGPSGVTSRLYWSFSAACSARIMWRSNERLASITPLLEPGAT